MILHVTDQSAVQHLMSDLYIKMHHHECIEDMQPIHLDHANCIELKTSGKIEAEKPINTPPSVPFLFVKYQSLTNLPFLPISIILKILLFIPFGSLSILAVQHGRRSLPPSGHKPSLHLVWQTVRSNRIYTWRLRGAPQGGP